MWTANLFETTSGRIGPNLEFEKASWSADLNGTEKLNFTLKKSALPKVNIHYWLAPWWAGVVLFYDGNPIVAGPILSQPTESFSDLGLSCGGIRSILDRRYIVDELSPDWSNISKTNVNFTGYSLGDIARQVVIKAQQKQGGMLPISFPIPIQGNTGSTLHERNYRGFNIQNIKAGDILTKLSNVANGPDIMFRPRLLRSNLLTFDMLYGSWNDPRIRQTRTVVFDTTTELGPVSDMRLTTTGTYQTSRVFSIGAGQDEGQTIKVVTNPAPMQAGFPILESSINAGNSENGDVTLAHGVANLISNTNLLREVEMTVRADGVNPIGSFWPGDLVQVYTKGWINFADGPHNLRLLAIAGDSGNELKLNLQEEDQFLSHDQLS